MKKKMLEERALFCQAICEGLVQKYEAEIALCPEPIQCSEEHLRKMNEIMEGHARAARLARLKRRIAAAVVAAALLVLTACAAYAYRGEIKEIFVKMRETYIKLFYDESDSMSDKAITEYYTFGYVPEGYELIEELRLAYVGESRWTNDSGDYLILEQHIWNGVNYSLDYETGTTTNINLGNIDIYCRATEIYTYIWNDGIYSFMLSSSKPLSNDELKMLLEEMKAEQ